MSREKSWSDEACSYNNRLYQVYAGCGAQGSLADIVAALLPCMWSYREIGAAFMKDPGALDHPLVSGVDSDVRLGRI